MARPAFHGETGVIFENSYDRSLSARASDCSKIGTTVIFDSSIDKNRDASMVAEVLIPIN